MVLEFDKRLGGGTEEGTRYCGPGQAIRNSQISWAPDEVRVGQLGPSAGRAELLGEKTQRDAVGQCRGEHCSPSNHEVSKVDEVDDDDE